MNDKNRLLIYSFLSTPQDIQKGLDSFTQATGVSPNNIVSINMMMNSGNPLVSVMNLVEVYIFYSYGVNPKQEQSAQSADS